MLREAVAQVQAVKHLEQTLQDAREKRDAAVTALHAAGVSAMDISRETGLSRNRVGQITRGEK